MASISESIVPQVYSKDSFDRFGTDLCEVLLSFLKLEDRFRFECLSKEWQTLIYRTQTHLTCIKKVNDTSFEWILKKCQNITKISSKIGSIDDSKFELIIKHCNHLNAIYTKFNALSVDPIEMFFTKCAKSMKSIES